MHLWDEETRTGRGDGAACAVLHVASRRTVDLRVAKLRGESAERVCRGQQLLNVLGRQVGESGAQQLAPRLLPLAAIACARSVGTSLETRPSRSSLSRSSSPRARSPRIAALALLCWRPSSRATEPTLSPGTRTSSRMTSSSDCGRCSSPSSAWGSSLRGSSQAMFTREAAGDERHVGSADGRLRG